MLRLTLMLLLVAQAPARSPEVEKELKAHQGVWRTESSRRNGGEAPKAIANSITRTVDGDRVVWRRDGKTFSVSTIILDPTDDPKTIDVHTDDDPARDKHVRGIYKLEDDTLTICTADPGRPRPSTFEAEKGDRHTLMVFKRVKTEAKSDAKSDAKP